ncbi:MAG: S9 family peptidase [Acidimicrobiales bacterium]
MRPTDLSLLRWPSSPTVSPDGTRVAMAVHRIDLEENGYRSDLWMVATDGSSPPRRLTRSGFDSQPRWSPDGRWIAFRRGGEDEPGQLHLLPVEGGEAVRMVEHPLGVDEITWSPDSTRIAYTARVPEAGRYQRGDGATPAGKEPPRRIGRLRYRLDGVGFLLDRPSHLFVVDPLAGEPEARQLTQENWEFGDPAWSPDGRWILCSTHHTDTELSLAGDIYAVAATGGELRRVTRSTTTVGPCSVSPDGLTVHYLGTDDLDLAGRSTSLFRVPFDGSRPPERVTDPDRWDLSDSHAAGRLIDRGSDLLALTGWRGAVEVVSIPAGGGEPVALGEGRHMVTDVSVGGATLAAVVSSATSAGEVMVRPAGAPAEEGTWRELTELGFELSRTAGLSEMEELEATSSDGYRVQGWLVCPPGPGPHPVVLAIHGGPATQYGYTLFDEAQVYAGAGLAVVMANPRGSSGNGEGHARAIVGDMGHLDRDDLLAVLDLALLDPRLDASRVGVMGGSYGGFMTTWLAAHDGGRFKAAISERAVNTWDSFEGSSDIGWYFGNLYCGPDPSARAAQSPLAHADGIDIPMLIIHSENDWRCPLEQAQRLFVHLKRRGVPTELLLFPGEGHELSRSGLPSHRLARFEAILDWWDTHL